MDQSTSQASAREQGKSLNGSQFGQGLKEIDALAVKLAEDLELVSPGHFLGWPKVLHMRESAEQAEHFGEALGLDKHSTELLRVGLGSHDIGRLEQALGSSEPGRTAEHGEIGAQILERSGISRFFTEEDWRTVLGVVRSHCVNEIPPDLSEEGRRIREYVRGIDYIELLGGDFLEPVGISKQIVGWYKARFAPELLRCSDFAHQVSQAVQTHLVGPAHTVNENIAGNEDIAQTVRDILEGGLTSECLASVQQRSRINPALISHSYATYMLAQLVLVFGMESPQLRQYVVDHNLLSSRIEFVSQRCSEEQRRIIESAFVPSLRG